jgi:hypothetical protein
MEKKFWFSFHKQYKNPSVHYADFHNAFFHATFFVCSLWHRTFHSTTTTNQMFFLPLTFLQASTLSTAKVSNVSLKAAQRGIKEFFSFSGDIVHAEMQRLALSYAKKDSCSSTCGMNFVNHSVLYSGDELSQVAYITFKDNQGAETAMLLTVLILSQVL